MGSSQSKQIDPVMTEKVAERLLAMNIHSTPDEGEGDGGYVYVDGEKPFSESHKSYAPKVSISMMEKWEKDLMEDPKNRLALSALTKQSAREVLLQRSSTLSTTQLFNTLIPFEGAPITNQRNSGRCWLFAATNVFRVALMKHHNLESFELSQAYVFFWDKLEKANYFLAQIVETAGEDLDGRLVQELLKGAVSDGGQWDMVANLVTKYGLIPQALYPDSYNAMNSSTMNSIIKTKLREDALRLRHLANSSASISSINSAKDEMLREIHLILTLMLGPPPSPHKEFTFEFYDKDKKFRSLTTTAIKFAQELSSSAAIKANSGSDVNRVFSLVNDPRNSYGELLTVSRLGNVVDGRGISYANVDMPTIKAACIAQLQAGIPVFFGSDVGQFSDRNLGIMDTGLLDYELGFNIRLGMSKAQRLRTGESAMTHAMVLTGVHIVDGKSVRWRVQNSWGKEPGDEGWFVMSDRWMDEFVYQAVVDPKFVSKEVRQILDKKPLVLPLWDPMGALA